MPTFDIVSRVDFAEIDNAINNTKKAILNRFDFRGSTYELNFDKKEKKLYLQAEDAMKLEAIGEMFRSAAVKRGLELKAFDWQETLPGPAGSVKRDVKIRQGLETEKAKEIVKLIKESKLKVQASIQGEEIRVTGKQIDDLQAVIQMLRSAELSVPLQFVNMKS
jgi:cyclic-di-GMP-binding protein